MGFVLGKAIAAISNKGFLFRKFKGIVRATFRAFGVFWEGFIGLMLVKTFGTVCCKWWLVAEYYSLWFATRGT